MFCQNSSAGIDEAFQRDADIIRLQHLKYYGELIEEYIKKTGKYPFQGQTQLQHYVHIANKKQLKYVQGGPPFEHKVSSVEEFRSELEKGLGRKIIFKYDPQLVPVYAPNFYIYVIKDDVYYFAVHIFKNESFSNYIAKNYNKVEITNSPEVRHGQWKLKDLMENPNFIEIINSTLNKNKHFKELENKYH